MPINIYLTELTKQLILSVSIVLPPSKQYVYQNALFVIDKDGIIRWSYVSPIRVNPSAPGVLNALESLESQKKKVGEPFRNDNRKAMQ